MRGIRGMRTQGLHRGITDVLHLLSQTFWIISLVFLILENDQNSRTVRKTIVQVDKMPE